MNPVPPMTRIDMRGLLRLDGRLVVRAQLSQRILRCLLLRDRRREHSTARGNCESPCGKSVEKTIRSSRWRDHVFTGSSSPSTDTKQLALEVRAGRHRQLGRVHVAPLPVLGHAPEEKRHPAAVPRGTRHASAGVAPGSRPAEAAAGQHLLHRWQYTSAARPLSSERSRNSTPAPGRCQAIPVR